MKITNIETFIVDAGWRPWIFVRVDTDEGISGWGECSDGRSPYGVTGTVRDLTPLLIGKDPRAYEMRFWDMLRGTRQSPGGIAAKAIAGVELALIDIKARALGISVVELFGGPTREQVRVYWSHCGTSRARNSDLLNTPPLRTMDDIAALGREVVERGYTALKTNIVVPGNPASVYFGGFGGEPGTTDGVVSRQILRHIETLIGTFRDAVGPDVDINLDLNFNFKPESCMRIAQVLEQFDLLWLEIDMYEPDAIRQIKDATSTKICTGENLFYMREFIPYFQARSADVFMIDVPWNGFAQSKKVGDLAEAYQLNVAPHNYYSHLSTCISASLCAVLPNVRIMEIDVDDVPWREDMVTNVPHIENGYLTIPSGPGWGIEMVEEVLKAHPWDKGNANW
ncbi:MAG: mandelate racemase/muconate lactonizing enzyme family protein [Gemmatimonadetes bacterium]|nr:mandelate racemase/muconate lactonizing enzyme family protein [Gemmatimonadota bacterium]MDE2955119.1 mandelate racemase/muconate lactonizing enzyme family protein [Gemmatimonadota bacterium]MXZ10298.1 mandelate racemase/muconate lactonizing enzyme family protein [Gemmatimonadota bacterium]MYD62886.1 mandelate racemase/muconate lactonizing enzyme family protein [Gemmatimonadota bacterium]MYF18631.1 mandelate racemase/muconate lactonizing enzyme family protein [Gemmatimonadota bacterium]